MADTRGEGQLQSFVWRPVQLHTAAAGGTTTHHPQNGGAALNELTTVSHTLHWTLYTDVSQQGKHVGGGGIGPLDLGVSVFALLLIIVNVGSLAQSSRPIITVISGSCVYPAMTCPSQKIYFPIDSCDK